PQFAFLPEILHVLRRAVTRGRGALPLGFRRAGALERVLEAVPRLVDVHLDILVLDVFLGDAFLLLHAMQSGATAQLARRLVMDLRAEERVELVLRPDAGAILPRKVKGLRDHARRGRGGVRPE